MSISDTYAALYGNSTPIADQPDQVCTDCGVKWGRYAQPTRIPTYWLGECGVCGRKKAVTEARDFGYLKGTWKGRK